MKTCGTCKYKGEVIKRLGDDTTNWEDVLTTYFLCARVQHDDRYGYEAKRQALVIDGSGYKAALCVESDFGCNLWEEK